MQNFDASKVRLGKLPATLGPNTPRFANYLKHKLPPAPVSADWGAAVKSWPMLANDRLGDCTCAAIGHMFQCWNANAGKSFVPTDDETIALYSAVAGYDPATGANDDGANEEDVLTYVMNEGYGGHKIAAFAALRPSHIENVKFALDMGGTLYLGVALPVSAQDQTGPGKIWTPTSGPDAEPGSWGGHAIEAHKYDDKTMQVSTWGQNQLMDYAWFQQYCDEAWLVLSQDWINAATQKAPSGFDWQSLLDDMETLKNG